MRIKIQAKIFIIVFVIVCATFSLVGCRDYGYSFHYRVDGGNGSIQIELPNGYTPRTYKCAEFACILDCPDNSFIVDLRGGKNGSRTLNFIAVPDDGYRVKEWTYNGEVVKDNKANIYSATVSYEEHYTAVIIVSFEPIV